MLTIFLASSELVENVAKLNQRKNRFLPIEQKTEILNRKLLILIKYSLITVGLCQSCLVFPLVKIWPENSEARKTREPRCFHIFPPTEAGSLLFIGTIFYSSTTIQSLNSSITLG